MQRLVHLIFFFKYAVFSKLPLFYYLLTCHLNSEFCSVWLDATQFLWVYSALLFKQCYLTHKWGKKGNRITTFTRGLVWNEPRTVGRNLKSARRFCLPYRKQLMMVNDSFEQMSPAAFCVDHSSANLVDLCNRITNEVLLLNNRIHII